MKENARTKSQDIFLALSSRDSFLKWVQDVIRKNPNMPVNTRADEVLRFGDASPDSGDDGIKAEIYICLEYDIHATATLIYTVEMYVNQEVNCDVHFRADGSFFGITCEEVEFEYATFSKMYSRIMRIIRQCYDAYAVVIYHIFVRDTQYYCGPSSDAGTMEGLDPFSPHWADYEYPDIFLQIVRAPDPDTAVAVVAAHTGYDPGVLRAYPAP